MTSAVLVGEGTVRMELGESSNGCAVSAGEVFAN